jgi:transposase
VDEKITRFQVCGIIIYIGRDLMGKQRRSYSAEFKFEALRLLETSGKSASEIERDLGIGDGCLLQWKRKLEAEGSHAFPGHGRLSADQEELVRLRRELEIVRQERDILKKAVAIFSRPNT